MFYARSTIGINAFRRASTERWDAQISSVSRPPWTILQIWLVVIIIQLPFFRTEFHGAGVRYDSTDILLLPLLFFLAFNRTLRSRFYRTPQLHLLIAYGVILSIAYIRFALEVGWFNSPVGVIYQLYRYAWKPLLFYPLVFVLFPKQHGLKIILHVLMLISIAAAIMGIQQGYSGLEVTGPLNDKNGFGGFMLIPISLALVFGVHALSWKERIFYGSCFLVILRALLFSQSRGALAGWFASLLCFGVISAYAKEGRKTLPLIILGGLFGVLSVLVLVGTMNRGDSLSHYRDLATPASAGTLAWRMQERWPHFFQKTVDNPWFGTGKDVDLSLGIDTNTPHNAYLAMAVKSGIPSLLVFLSFIVIALRRAVLVIRSGRDKGLRWSGAGILSAIVGLSVHSLVDGILSGFLVQIFFWVLLAWTTVAAVTSKNAKRVGGNNPG